jgi:hypothetical protein
MRKILILFPLLMTATPALAQEAPPAFQLPRELTDPQAQMKLAVRVGELGAALEGRQATRRERNVTVGDLVHRQDPNFEQHVQQKVATIGPKVLQTMQTVNRTLPQVMHDVEDVQRSVDRAVANLPDPTYPVR